MNPEQYKHFCPMHDVARAPGLTDLVDRSPRTLLYGHALNRALHHVYIGEDGFLHVLKYSRLYDKDGASTGGLDFLILKHSYGEAGGLASAAEYVQRRRVYPERSDYEFCTLLEEFGISVPFLSYRNSATQDQRYHGAVVGRGRSEKGVDLVADVREQLALPEMAGARSSLAYRVVGQAVRETAAPYAAMGMISHIYVAESAAARVLQKVAEYLFDMYNIAMLDVDVPDLLATVFGSERNLTVESQSEHFGCASFEVNSFGPAPLVGAGYESYAARAHSYPAGVVVGTYRGRPYLVYAGQEGKYHLQLSQFGDPGRFLFNNLKQRELLKAA